MSFMGAKLEIFYAREKSHALMKQEGTYNMLVSKERKRLKEDEKM